MDIYIFFFGQENGYILAARRKVNIRSARLKKGLKERHEISMKAHGMLY
jgi:hypothetical protein